MPSIKKWNGVPGSMSIECGQHADGVWATADKDRKVLPEIVVQELKALFPAADYDEISFDIEIDYRCTGYYDPGVNYGPPERCYPPEGDNEPSLDGQCVVSFYGGLLIDGEEKTKKLSDKASQALFDEFYEEIQERDVEDGWDDGPDY